MDLNLTGKVVIITGGGSNIGRGISLAFAQEGSNVVISELDVEQGNKVAKKANALSGSGKCICIKCDVTKWDEVQEMVKKTLDTFGSIDILVNGVGATVDKLFIEKSREEWDKEIQVNFWSNINCTRAVLDHMIDKKRGAIVSIGSDAGRMGEYREVVYSGTKGAVIAMSKALARELGRYNIRLNVVCPGLTVPKPEEIGEMSIWHEQIKMFSPDVLERARKVYPLRKLGTAEDIANAVLFLASDRCAGHITGQTLSVSGGYTMM